MEEKSFLSHVTFTKLIQCVTEKDPTSFAGATADTGSVSDYAIKQNSISHETVSHDQTSAIQHASAVTPDKADYALQMIIAEKAFLSNETLTKLIQHISEVKPQTVGENYALQAILEEKLSLSDETLATLLRFTSRKTETIQNVADGSISTHQSSGSVSEYAINVIMEERDSLGQETLSKLIQNHPMNATLDKSSKASTVHDGSSSAIIEKVQSNSGVPESEIHLLPAAKVEAATVSASTSCSSDLASDKGIYSYYYHYQ